MSANMCVCVCIVIYSTNEDLAGVPWFLLSNSAPCCPNEANTSSFYPIWLSTTGTREIMEGGAPARKAEQVGGLCVQPRKWFNTRMGVV